MKQYFCERCNQELDREDMFCRKCGAAVSRSEESETASDYDDEPAVENISYQPDSEQAVEKVSSGSKLKKLIIWGIIIFCIIKFISSMHVCDMCHQNFLGTSYYDGRNYNTTLCAKCAAKYFNPFPISNWEKR